MDTLAERLAALEAKFETSVNGKGGLFERLSHLDKCVDKLKHSQWWASGALATLMVAVNWWFSH